jgi:hypothetical protein
LRYAEPLHLVPERGAGYLQTLCRSTQSAARVFQSTDDLTAFRFRPSVGESDCELRLRILCPYFREEVLDVKPDLNSALEKVE